MPRDIPVGNGNMLIAFDNNYILREFYFPRVGQENHTKGEPFRFGVWVNGKFKWISEGWEKSLDYLDDTLVTNVTLINNELKVKITAHDLVDFHENIYVKKLTVENLSSELQEVRLFLCHDFHIYGNDIGDTAAFRPEVNGLLHYKGERYFLINACANKKCGIDQFATGHKEQQGAEGTWKDAEDGILSGNPITQGSVDSCIAIHLKLKAKASDTCFYWVCAGRNWNEVKILNSVIWEKTPEVILKRTLDYWKLWVDKEELNYGLLPEKITWLYKRSLLITRTQIDNGGAIIAGNDSDVVQFNRDTYSYMWPRDGALVAYALDLAGYSEITRRFFNFCAQVIDKEGYFLHKYTPSGAVASSWHPWLKDKKPQIPIQEDETALVIWALWNHYNIFKDIEFIKPLYKHLIKNAADFMLRYRDNKTKLPLPSYDLWEERQGILTFTVSAVYAGLMAAASFAQAFGETDVSKSYERGAFEIREAMDKYLYLEKEKRFARMINFNNDKIEIDATIDASLYGVFAFGAYSADDKKVVSTMEQIYEKLWCNTEVGGLCRYENDSYHRVSNDVTGNPWFITTLWLAQYYIARARSRGELDKSLSIMQWVKNHALRSGCLAEQVNPYTNEPISVSPLTWSHGTFILTVQEYINKLLEIEKCTACTQSKYSKKRMKT
ncbi:MAG: glycoside hydrolase family 15 [Candidatus Omnitrophica bacterium CG22_combo_CG10-13_8_21_14_all_43_16]|nr:MAG: glycoside hydrolase family 15 [Candidatus Omnitrophica bacterium CG22_combo_CG10-13_8_21_14_all_43_16]